MTGRARRLDEESEGRFLDLYGHLLVYVNDRFDVVEGIETLEELERTFADHLRPIRNELYNGPTGQLIEEFVEANPVGLSEPDRRQVAAWTDHVAGSFVIVRYRPDDAVFLDPTDPPTAYAVRGARVPFTDRWTGDDLPIPVSDVVLLPFERRIVYDGWIGLDDEVFPPPVSVDVDDEYAEAVDRSGIVESLPAPDGSDSSVD